MSDGSGAALAADRQCLNTRFPNVCVGFQARWWRSLPSWTTLSTADTHAVKGIANRADAILKRVKRLPKEIDRVARLRVDIWHNVLWVKYKELIFSKVSKIAAPLAIGCSFASNSRD
jgi:hypothetical protein